MKKYGAILTFCLMVCVLFSGCGQVTQLTTIYADGSRAYTYNISINSSVLSEYGITDERAFEVIDESTQTYWTAFSDGRTTNGVTFKSGKSSTQNTYQISLAFSSFEAYCNFYGASAGIIASQPADIRSGVFSSKNVIVDSAISNNAELYVEMNLIPAFVNEITQHFADEFFAGDLNAVTALFSKIKTNLIRSYPASLKVKSNAQEKTSYLAPSSVSGSDADTLYDAFLWECTLAEPTTDMFIYRTVYTSKNRMAWYLLCIGLALVFGAVLFVIFYLRHKKEGATTTDAIRETTTNPFVEKSNTEEKNTENEIAKVINEESKLPETKNKSDENKKDFNAESRTTENEIAKNNNAEGNTVTTDNSNAEIPSQNITENPENNKNNENNKNK